MLIIGVLVGSIAGYCGGKVDLIIMRIVDMIYSLPDMLMVILLSVVLKETLGPVIEGTVFDKIGTNMLSLFLVFGFLYWVSMARLVRGQILSVKENEYILAARAIGTKPGRIIRKHILPNCLAPIIVQATLSIAGSILAIASLSFIGLGISPPTPEWGSMVSTGRQFFRAAWWVCAFPGLAIMLTILSLNLLGDGLRDALDPKLKN